MQAPIGSSTKWHYGRKLGQTFAEKRQNVLMEWRALDDKSDWTESGNFNERRVDILDSFNNNSETIPSKEWAIRILVGLLRKLAKIQSLPKGSVPNVGAWAKCVDAAFPQQVGNDNCGVFLLLARITEGTDVGFFTCSDVLSFGQTSQVQCPWRLEDKSKVIVPVHLHSCHWTLAVADIQALQVDILDSMNENGQTHLSKLMAVDFVLSMLEFVGSVQNFHIEAKGLWGRNVLVKVPQQATNDDCGIFTAIYARRIVEGRPNNFSQSHIPFFRRQICQFFLSHLL